MPDHDDPRRWRGRTDAKSGGSDGAARVEAMFVVERLIVGLQPGVAPCGRRRSAWPSSPNKAS